MVGTMAVRRRAVLQVIAIASMFVLLLIPISSENAGGTFTNDPLVVEGDSGFLAAGFTGTGTPSDPYILSGLSVDATNELHGIYIANTTKHFRIVDCTVHDAYSPQRDVLNISASGSGIILVNVSNGEIAGFLSDYNVRGVTVVNSRNISITTSQFSNNIEAGVYFYGCAEGGCSVSACTFERGETGKDGVLVEDSCGTSILDNEINDGVTGIRLVASSAACSENVVEGNQLQGQTNGIVLEGEVQTTGNMLRDNIVSNATEAGIYVGWGTLEQITENTVSGCLYGVRLGWGGNTVAGNVLTNNTRGLSLDQGADANSIRDNLIMDGEVGVLIAPSQGNMVHNNTIVRMNRSNASVGVYLGVGQVTNASVTNNSISDCSVGVRAATTYSQTITGLSVVGNNISSSDQEGLYLLYVSYSQVRNNSISANEGSGGMIYHCRNMEVAGNDIGWNQEYGLRMQGTDDSLLVENVLCCNYLEGIYLDSGSGNVIHGNALVFNKDSGRQYSALRSQAYCGEEGNQWALSTGNLWSDWLSPDNDEDGVVDLPYNITGGFQDPYPLTNISGLIIPEDIVPPTVREWTPQGTSAQLDSEVRVTFSEDMKTGSVEALINNVTVDGTWDDRSLVLGIELEFETEYTVRITGQDLAGNIMIEFQWTFRTEGPNATVDGRVLDEDGGPLSGALVVCGDETALTDEHGLFSLVLTPGNHTLRVSMEGFEKLEMDVQVLPGQDVELEDMVLIREESASSYYLLAIVGGAAIMGAVLLLWRRSRR